MLITIDHRLNAKALGLNANEASVLAAITKCTQMGKGWYSDYAALTDALEFSISVKTVGRAVKKLVELGVVEKRQNVLYAKTNCPQIETKCPSEGTNCPSPALSIKEKNIKESSNSARANAHDATTDDFYRFRDLYLSKNSNPHIWRNFETAAYTEWHAKKLLTRTKILDAVSKGEPAKLLAKNNPLYYLQDFPEPQPTNYNDGKHTLDRKTQYVTAKWNGRYGLYTAEEAEAFGMEDRKAFRV